MAGCRRRQPQDLFGSKPKGSLILTPEDRAMALTTAENRVSGDGDAERAALHKSMLAYTGRYRVEGSELVTTVDTSWNEAWNGNHSSGIRWRLNFPDVP